LVLETDGGKTYATNAKKEQGAPGVMYCSEAWHPRYLHPRGVDDVNLNAALFDFTGISRENAAATKPGSGRDAFSPGSALTLILVSS
jgi:hypothetical protein